jgi:DNA mismatch endonuclease (patch repair protein)
MKKTKEQISYNMRQIKNKDSEIELLLRCELWRRNIRYRKNATNIVGKPDVVFIRKKIAVFIDSEFWHGFDWENKKNDFKSNKEFWISKIERNIERDKEVNALLQAAGWTVIRFWGNEIKKNVAYCADIIEKKYREK